MIGRWVEPRLTGCLVVLCLGCTRAERSPSREVDAPRPAPPEASASSLGASPPSLRAELELECRELGAEPHIEEPAGGGVVRLKDARSASLPTGSIAYVSEEKIWVVSSDGQRRRRLGRGSLPRWHPRATSLLFVAALADRLPRLFEVSTDCRAVRMLTGPLTTETPESSEAALDTGDISYAMSPSGEHVAFTRRVESGYALYVTTLATGSQRQLAGDVDSRELAWLPDSRSLAFITGESEDASVMSLELATGQARQLASVRSGRLAVLPDRRVLFQSAFDANGSIEARQAHLYWTEPPRAAARLLSGSGLGPGSYDELRASPDGTKLAASWSLWTGNGPAAVRDHGLAVFSLPPSAPSAASPAELRRPGTPFDAHDPILFTRPKVPNASASASGERYASRAPSWAPNSRHLVFELADCGDSFAECRSRIVAVDSAAARAPLVFLASGSAPVWASH